MLLTLFQFSFSPLENLSCKQKVKKKYLNKNLKSEVHVCASCSLQTEFNSEGKALGSILNDNDQPTFMLVAEKAAVASSATLALFLSHRSFGSTYESKLWHDFQITACFVVGIVQRETLSAEQSPASQWRVAGAALGPLQLSLQVVSLPAACHDCLSLQCFHASRCQDAHCMNAANGSQFSQTLGYRPGTKQTKYICSL